MKSALLCAGVAFSGILCAQTADQLQSFRVEYSIRTFGLDLSWYSAELNDALQSGNAELRQQIQFDAPARQLAVWTFSVPVASTPLTAMADVQKAPIEKYRVNVDKVGFSGRTISFTGVVATGAVASVTEVSAADAYLLTADYYPGNASEIRNLQLTIANFQRAISWMFRASCSSRQLRTTLR